MARMDALEMSEVEMDQAIWRRVAVLEQVARARLAIGAIIHPHRVRRTDTIPFAS